MFEKKKRRSKKYRGTNNTVKTPRVNMDGGLRYKYGNFLDDGMAKDLHIKTDDEKRR